MTSHDSTKIGMPDVAFEILIRKFGKHVHETSNILNNLGDTSNYSNDSQKKTDSSNKILAESSNPHFSFIY